MVLIIVDTLRADHVYGNRARTPNMDSLARDGLRFTEAYPEAMPTVPARNSILSGRRQWPYRDWHRHRGMVQEPGWEPFARADVSFTTALQRAGYWTGYVTDNPFLGFAPGYERLRRSFDRFVRRGGQVGGTGAGVSERELRHWLPPAVDDPETRERMRKFLANARYSRDETNSFAARVFRSGAKLLDVAKRNRPFCMVLDTFEPHEPWTPPRRYIDMYGDPDYRGPEPAKPYYAPAARYMSAGERRVLLPRMRALYAAEVTMTDRWLGVFLDRLHDLRLDRDTIVVLTSDHGFLLGEHGWTGKSPTQLHPELIRVPLTIVHPERKRAGRSVSYLVQSHDIGPTILAMAGVRAPRTMNGVNLSRFFRGKRPPERPLIYGGYTNSFYMRTERWALSGNNGGGDLSLHDLRTDRRERRDVTARRPQKARQLRGAVRRRAGPLPRYGYPR